MGTNNKFLFKRLNLFLDIQGIKNVNVGRSWLIKTVVLKIFKKSLKKNTQLIDLLQLPRNFKLSFQNLILFNLFL